MKHINKRSAAAPQTPQASGHISSTMESEKQNKTKAQTHKQTNRQKHKQTNKPKPFDATMD